jgi:hypothetical protein
MKNVKSLVEIALNTKNQLEFEKQVELDRQAEAKRTREERFNELYEKVVVPYIDTMQAVGFQYRNEKPRYCVNPTASAMPSLRLEYHNGADVDSIYLNINIVDKYDNMELSFSGKNLVTLTTKDFSDENLDMFLEHAVKESMKIMVI